MKQSGKVQILEQPPLELDFDPQHFSLSDDGSRIVIAHRTPQADVWDLTERQLLSSYTAEKHEPAELWTAISPDGKHGLLTHPSGRVDVFETNTGKKVFAHEAPEPPVGPVAVSGDGQFAFLTDQRPAMMAYPLLGGQGGSVYYDRSKAKETDLVSSTSKIGYAGFRSVVPGPSQMSYYITYDLNDQMVMVYHSAAFGASDNYQQIPFEELSPKLRVVPGFTGGMAAEKSTFLAGRGLITQITFGKNEETGQLSAAWTQQFSRITEAEGVGLVDGECLVIVNPDGLVEFQAPEADIAEVHVILPTQKTADQVTVSRNGRVIARREPNNPRQVRIWHVKQIPLVGLTEFAREVRATLSEKNFVLLDQLYDEFLQSEATIPGGTYPRFASGLMEIIWRQRNQPDLVENWKNANPESVLCRALEAETLTNKAWNVRGSGYAAQVGRERILQFGQLMSQAAQILASIPSEKAPVHAYRSLAKVAQALSWDDEDISDLVDRILKTPYAADADFHDIVAVNRLARWGGSDGYSRDYALDMKERIGGVDGLRVFVGIAFRLQCFFKTSEFLERTKFTREEIATAVDNLEKFTSKTDPFLVNARLYSAWSVDETNTVGATFDRFREAGAPYLSKFWTSADSFERAYIWCRAMKEYGPYNEVRPMRSRRNSKTEPDPRFVDQGQYIKDQKTGLLWDKQGSLMNMTYYEGSRYADRLRSGGLQNWRLPTFDELREISLATTSLFNDIIPDNSVVEDPQVGPVYWVSMHAPAHSGDAYVLHWRTGGVLRQSSAKSFASVRCVHDPVTEAGPSTLKP